MNFFRPEHSHSKGRISVKFIRLDSHIEVRYRFCGIKKEYCSPEDVCEGLFIKADSEIQHLIEKWRDNHNKLQECKNKQILASQNIANRQMGSKRGSYKTSYNLNQDEFTKPQDRHYFCSQHRDYAGLILSNVFSAKRGEKWSGQIYAAWQQERLQNPTFCYCMDGWKT